MECINNYEKEMREYGYTAVDQALEACEMVHCDSWWQVATRNTIVSLLYICLFVIIYILFFCSISSSHECSLMIGSYHVCLYTHR